MFRGEGQGTGQSIHVGDGSTVPIDSVGDGSTIPSSYMPPAGCYLEVTKDGNNYLFTDTDQSKQVYKETGELLELEDSNGNKLVYTYEPISVQEIATAPAGPRDDNTGVFASEAPSDPSISLRAGGANAKQSLTNISSKPNDEAILPISMNFPGFADLHQ